MSSISEELYDYFHKKLKEDGELRLANLKSALDFVHMSQERGIELEVYEHKGEFVIFFPGEEDDAD